VADVTAATLREAILEDVDSRARLMTDEYSAYRWLKKGWTGTHETVCHRTFEYARGDVHVNTAESSHALIRRGSSVSITMSAENICIAISGSSISSGTIGS